MWSTWPMKRILCLALLVSWGCQREGRRRPLPDKEAGKAVEQVSTAPLEARVVPWSPRLSAAKFFTREADSWNEHELALTDYTLDVQVAEGVSTVTLDVSIKNPTTEQAEAVIDLPIPPGAAVTDATLWVGEKPMVGVMLGSAKAREVYDKIVGRRRDPLLVAWNSADMLSLSVFPLEGQQTRRFKVSWVEPAVADRQWVPSFANRGKTIGYPKTLRVGTETVKRDGDWVTIPMTRPSTRGDWRMKQQGAMTPTSVAVVVDTSGYTSTTREQQWNEISAFIEAFGGAAKVTVVSADWLVSTLGSGRELSDFAVAKKTLLATRPAGIFEQKQALATAQSLVGATGAVAVFSSGYPMNTLPDSVGPVAVHWVHPSPGAIGSEPIYRRGGRAFADGASLAAGIHSSVEPEEAGYDWLPLTAATGHQIWLGSRKNNHVSGQGRPTPVEALFYKAMLRRADIPLNKIVSPQTSILVLESEEHYKKWGVKDNKGEVVRDQTPNTGDIGELLQDGKIGAGGWGYGISGIGSGGGGIGWGTIGTGTYGTIGHGGGTGSGYGIGMGSSMRGRRQSSPPQIRIGNAEVRGDLDKNIIRRYIRRKLPRIRYCYEKQLLVHEELVGRATVTFTISGLGQVVQATATLDHKDGKATADCIRRTILSIRFPKPKGGGMVRVSYPFVLTPGAASLWSKVRKHRSEGGPAVVRKVGDVFGYKGPDNQIELAWWLVENQMRASRAPASAIIEVARLLRAADPKAERDVRRILSEGARRFPAVIADTFKEWGHPQDAARVRELNQP